MTGAQSIAGLEQQRPVPELLRHDVLGHVHHVYGVRGSYGDCRFAALTSYADNPGFKLTLAFLNKQGDIVHESDPPYKARKYELETGYDLDRAVEEILQGLGFKRENFPDARQMAAVTPIRTRPERETLDHSFDHAA